MHFLALIGSNHSLVIVGEDEEDFQFSDHFDIHDGILRVGGD